MLVGGRALPPCRTALPEHRMRCGRGGVKRWGKFSLQKIFCRFCAVWLMLNLRLINTTQHKTSNSCGAVPHLFTPPRPSSKFRCSGFFALHPTATPLPTIPLSWHISISHHPEHPFGIYISKIGFLLGNSILKGARSSAYIIRRGKGICGGMQLRGEKATRELQRRRSNPPSWRTTHPKDEQQYDRGARFISLVGNKTRPATQRTEAH